MNLERNASLSLKGITINHLLFIIVIFVLLPSCGRKDQGRSGAATGENASGLFTLLNSATTGISFSNDVTDGEKFNIFTYRNYYNGAGVAIGDINNDSLPDIYFTANQGKNKLYLNKGSFRFEDITEKAGVGGTMAWSTGVTMADVNGDGFLDIYVCNAGDVDPKERHNELFINSGDLTFTERAAEYNLDNDGLSIHAAFFDYDGDGDLDCYILNNFFTNPSKIELYKKVREGSRIPGDKLMRNDGGRFMDVTAEAGIFSSEIGFGNGIGIADINHDNLPDIYVANDFWERDYLYINRGNGKFSEEFNSRFNYCSTSSMGGDIADINNDGNMDIFTTDMLPADNYRIQTTIAFDPFHLEDMKYRENFYYQISQNCLHINDDQGYFRELGMLAGVDATDWSWGSLIFDFENDGRKDLFVSNGIIKDIMDRDFLDFYSDRTQFRNFIQRKGRFDYRDFVPLMPSKPLSNYAFHNDGTLKFRDEAAGLGLAEPSFSNGAAYADLDNDGDMDLVINNENSPCFIYRNNTEKLKENHHLKVKFEGPRSNPFGIGAIVTLKLEGETRVLQNFNSRGFESSTVPELIFGLGKAETAEELTVSWPDGAMQTLPVARAGTIILKYSDADKKFNPPQPRSPGFEDVTSAVLNSEARHTENRYNDFEQEPLLFHMLSTEGPRLICGDVNKDRREDFILLGAAGDPDKLFIQKPDGTFSFRENSSFSKDRGFESTCGLLTDIDADGAPDLIIGSGGNDVTVDQMNYIVRVYKNDGNGSFTADPMSIPPVLGNLSVIRADDFDGDGNKEFFFGARMIPGNYGITPKSYLLRLSKGVWTDLTPEYLSGIGMVTDAAWADADSDGDNDLVVVGDWMPVYILTNDKGTLTEPVAINGSSGWWTRIAAADLDRDGNTDFVLGNWGLNTKFKASADRPLTMHVSDFDNNGKSEFIVCWYPPLDDRAYPWIQRNELLGQMPGLKKTIPSYARYGLMTYDSLFSRDARKKALDYKTEYLESAVLWNEGGKLTLRALPTDAQVSPVFAILADDFDGDGITDIWLGGNFYGVKPQVGRYDASKGILLKGDNNRSFTWVPQQHDSFRVTGEIRDAALVKTGQLKNILIARNNDKLLIFRNKVK